MTSPTESNEVSGLVFVDSAHENQSQRMAEVSEAQASPIDPMSVILRGCRLMTPVGLFRLFGVSDAFFANIPYSTEQYAEITATTNKNGYCEAIQYEYDLLQTFAQEEQALPDLGDTPLIFLGNTATVEQVLAVNKSTDMTVEDIEKSLQVVAELGQEIANLSTQGEWRPTSDTNHYIHLDKPEVVLTAIRDVLTAVSETHNK